MAHSRSSKEVGFCYLFFYQWPWISLRSSPSTIQLQHPPKEVGSVIYFPLQLIFRSSAIGIIDLLITLPPIINTIVCLYAYTIVRRRGLGPHMSATVAKTDGTRP